MESYQVSVIALVNLIRDSEKGFYDLSLHVQNEQCRVYLLEEAYVRQTFARELEDLLNSYLEEPMQASGSTSGILHRAWLDLRSEFGAGDQDLLDALHTCEHSALKAYTTVLEDESLPQPLRILIERQLRHVRPLQQRLTTLFAQAINAAAS